MTIWHLLSVTAFFAPLISSLQTARVAHVGIGAYVISVLIGALLGTFGAWSLWLGNKLIFRRVHQDSPLRQLLVVIPVLLVSIAWVVLGGYCGELATRALLRVL
jgi:membrane protein required for beta-lactamase induction